MRHKTAALILLGWGLLAVAPVARAAEPIVKRFVDKVYRSADGVESRYVVYVPKSYDGQAELPVIVFLHGAGHSGTDGRDQLTGALAAAIGPMQETFAFLAVFPQAQQGDWQAESEDGRRVLAILDEVAGTYRVDARRVALTGVSMGAEGTWSLAAAHPDRWCAIVPVAGGGDETAATKIKSLPCWCFHGDADEVIRVNESRSMIRAIKEAGGRPQFTELRRMGHTPECWARVYSNPDLYEWLLLQRKPAR